MRVYQSNQSLLRKSLRANALFSLLSGILLIIAAGLLAGVMFVEPVELFGFGMDTILFALGIGIVIFAADVWLISRAERISLLQSKLIVLLDVGWVIGSSALLLLWPDVFSTAGTVSIIVVAIVVADLGFMELLGILMTYEGESEVTADYQGDHLTITAALATDVPSDLVWSVMRQQEKYAEVADNISSVKVIRGSAKGLVRECTDNKGQTWRETCTRWDEGEGFAFRIHTDAPDYPYPIAELAGDWSVSELGSGSRIRMVFQAKAKNGLMNKLAFKLIAVPFAPLCDRLMHNWVRMMKKNAPQGTTNRPEELKQAS